MKTRIASLWARICDGFRRPALRRGSFSLLLAGGVLALAILLNLVLGALPDGVTALDTTPDRRFTLTDQTRQIIAGLREDVTLVWVTETGAEDEALGKLLERYAGSSSRIELRKLDPVSSPAALRAWAGDDADQLENNSVIVASQRRSKILKARYDIYSYSDYASYYQYYQYYGEENLDRFVAERSVSSALRTVTEDDLPVVYLISGHGEQDLSPLYGEIELENLRVEELDLRTAGAVPADCGVLLLAAPERDLGREECEAIRSYLQGGGSFLLLTVYVEAEKMPNLLALMAETTGIRILDGTVFEDDADLWVYYPFYLYPRLESHAITEALSEGGYRVIVPDGQALVLPQTAPEGVSVQPLLRTGDRSFSHVFAEGEDADEFDYTAAEGDPRGPFALAAAVTAEGADGVQSRVVWQSGVYFLDSMVNEMSAGANMDFFLNCLGWMCEHEESLGIREIVVNDDFLTMSAGAVTGFTVVFAALIPAVFAAAGVVTVVRRRGKQ